MKTIATMALQKGMTIGTDILNFRNELLVPKKTVVDDSIIAKLNRHSIMCVEIMEAIDFASTHYEKVRLSEAFKQFESTYKSGLDKYKLHINDVISKKTSIDIKELFNIYYSISKCAKTGENLLDYLYNMLPSEDDLTYAHCLNAALIAGVFGTWLALPREDEITLICSGFLYDVGKIVMPNSLIWKPGRLTDEEFELMKTHTFKGYGILKDQKLNDNIIKAVLQHHEKSNGNGYPSRLKGDDINFFARIINIIDSYEAMTSARTYRETLIPFQVIKNFENTCDNYSQPLLKSILSHIANNQLGTTVRLNDESVAEVILINANILSRPLVKTNDKIIDLSKEKDYEIVAIL